MAKLHPSTSENIKQTPTKHIIIHCKNLSGDQPPMFSVSWPFPGDICLLHSLRNPPKSAHGDAVPDGDGQNHLTVVVDEGPQIALPVLRRHDRSRCWPRWQCCQVAMDAMDMDGDVREMIWDDGIPCFKLLHGTSGSCGSSSDSMLCITQQWKQSAKLGTWGWSLWSHSQGPAKR